MPYNPKIHHRRSIRLKGYDYSKAGLYFITMCVQDRQCLFANVVDGTLVLNDAGRMIERWYHELENKFTDRKCHEMVVMPNHFHCIIENVPVGADLRVCPKKPNEPGSPQPDSPQRVSSNPGPVQNAPISQVVQWFKTMTTNEYIRGVKQLGWQPFNKKLWQRDYWEHIIRTEKSFQRISNYIIDNPQKWIDDKFHQK